MQKRKLGNSNLEVSALGLGCMRMIFGCFTQEAIKANRVEVELLEKIAGQSVIK